MITGDAAASFQRLLALALPSGGWIMPIIEAYFDESGTHDGAMHLCVAGYIMEKGQAQLFSEEWADYLAFKGLEYFRMSECAHRSKQFKGRDDCLEVEKKLIDLVKQRATAGLVGAAAVTDFKSFFRHPDVSDMYSAIIGLTLSGVRHWIEQTAFEGEALYIFESGHSSRSVANAMMNDLFAYPGRERAYRYAGHSFLPKRTCAIQAADLLAWQQTTNIRRSLQGKPVRKDFASLLELPHIEAYLSAKMMLQRALKNGHTIKPGYEKIVADILSEPDEPNPGAIWPQVRGLVG